MLSAAQPCGPWGRSAVVVAAPVVALALVVGAATPAGATPWTEVSPPPTLGPGPAGAPERSGAAAGPAPEVRAVVRYRPPAPGPVLRGFAAPTTAYGPGHRGVKLAARPGSVVGSAAVGTVAFVGTVAGVRWVTVQHADGVLTSYGPLSDIAVQRGQVVAAGTSLGRLAAGGTGPDDDDTGLHWGARRGGRYLDPLTLLDADPPRPTLVGAGGWQATDPVVTPYAPWAGTRARGLLTAPSPEAVAPGYAAPPSHHQLVLVAGLGTDDASALIDPGFLGYPDGQVTRFSYAGLDADGRPLPYGPPDTWGDIDAAARRLREQLRAHRREHPVRAVDLVGHSMGGVVIAHYLAVYHDPHDRTLPAIGSVVTIASPLRGSAVADVGTAVRDHGVLSPLLTPGVAWARRTFDGGPARLPWFEPALDQLAVGSAFRRELGTAWDQALAAGDTGPLGLGTRVLTIGGAGDRVVPVVATGRPVGPGSPYLHGYRLEHHEPLVEHRVLPGDHSGVLRTEAVHEGVWRFLAGEQVTHSPGHVALVTHQTYEHTLRGVAGALWSHDLIRLQARGRPLTWIE